MGNSPITLGIRTDATSYTAGSKITGRVYVSVSKDPQPAQALILKISGEEKVLIHHTTSSSSSSSSNHDHNHTEDRYERETVSFLRMEYPLHTFSQGQLQPGQYEYPFEIQLPRNLPSTMNCQSGESHCEVKYTLCTTIQKPASSSISIGSIFNNAMNNLSSSSSAENEVQILSSVPINRINNHNKNHQRHLPVEHIPVTKCCCLGKGQMKIEANIEPTIVQPNDAVRVEFQAENNSSIKVKRVCTQIEQIVEWKCTGHVKTVKTMLDRYYIRDITCQQFPELQSTKEQRRSDRSHRHRQRRRRSHRRCRDDPPNFEEVLPEDDTFTRQPTSWHTTQLRIPSHSQDTYSGRNIQVRHVLSVQLQTKGCCTSNPEISTLLRLCRNFPKGIVSATTASGDARDSNGIDDFCYYTDGQQNVDHPLASPTSSAAATAASQVVTPSAPPSNYDDIAHHQSQSMVVQPTAPPSTFDDDDIIISNSYNMATSQTPPMAEACVLPQDWNAQTAEVVNIPMVDAIILEPEVKYYA